PGSAQGHGDAHGHALAHLESGDRLPRAPNAGTLAHDHAELLGGGLEDRRRLLGLADPHVEGDLLDRRHPHPARVAEPRRQRAGDLGLVPLAQPRRRSRLLCLCDGRFHQPSYSIAFPVRFEKRTRLPSPPTRMPTRVGLLSVGSSSITLETSIGPSFSMMPPSWALFWVSFTDRGRWWRLTMA